MRETNPIKYVIIWLAYSAIHLLVICPATAVSTALTPASTLHLPAAQYGDTGHPAPAHELLHAAYMSDKNSPKIAIRPVKIKMNM
jgi:hypothetical protein